MAAPKMIDGGEEDFNDDFEDLEDGAYCFDCGNTGWIECECGGDMCVCDNYGEMPCPKCNFD